SGKRRFVREFQVMRSGQVLGSAEGMLYTDPAVEAGKRYEYKVFALSTGGIISDASGPAVVEVADVPAAPEGLSAQVVEEGVRLSWSHPGEGPLFNVYRSYEDPTELLRPVNREPLREAGFTDNPLMQATVYYAVRALLGGAERNEGPASGVVKVSPEEFVPSAPEGLQAVNAGAKVLLAWKENPEMWVKAYRIYRASGGGDYAAIGESGTPSFIDGEVTGGRVSYKVTAVGPTAEGPFSAGAVPSPR
ncbi:MAG: hypothetical protein PVJ36_06370, partial [Nitrospirota bacterium]